MLLVSSPSIYVANNNPITFEVPKMMYDECFLVTDDNTRLFTQYRKNVDVSMSTVSVDTHFSLFNIFNEANLHKEIYSPDKKSNFKSAFPILGLVMSSNNWGVADMSYMAVADKMV